MKRNVFSLLFLLFLGLGAAAQTEQGSWMVGGNLGLNTAKNNSEVTIAPTAGYFFLNNFAAGATLNFSYTKDLNNKTTTLGAGPFARYYFGTMNIRPFAVAEFLYESTKYKTGLSSTTQTVNGSSFLFGGGLAGFINRNVAIEGIAGYKNTSIADGPNTGGFNLRVGFQVYLSKAQVQDLKGGKL